MVTNLVYPATLLLELAFELAIFWLSLLFALNDTRPPVIVAKATLLLGFNAVLGL